MGISLSWVAVEALPADDALSRLGLMRTGKPCTYPFKGAASLVLPNHWFLVAAGRCDHRIGNAHNMAKLSAGCRAVTCAIEEHVNFASTELWQDGQLIWHVEHQGDNDPEHMSFEGDVPQRFHALLSTVEPKDSENLEGHFHMDIPLILAKELTGFRHDEANPELDDTPFDELQDLQARSRWWKLWL
jgi:hypothetical protein